MMDLHIHSNFSDGKLGIDEIEKLAQKNSIKVIAITDHDNIKSTKYIQKSKFNSNIVFIPGIELSTETYFFKTKLKVHILGYGYNCYDKKLNDNLQAVHDRRAYYNELYINEAIKKFSFLSREMFQDFDYGQYGWIKKLILEQIKSCITTDNLMVLNEYLNNVKPIYNGYNLKVEEAINMLKQSNCYSIIAHPFKLKLNDLELNMFIDYLISCGLSGIESFHKEAAKEQSDLYHNIALKNDLYESGGSDFHSFDYGNIGIDNEGLNTKNNKLVKKIILENKFIGGKYDSK